MKLLIGLCALAAASAFAVPTVGDIEFVPEPASGTVKLSYVLSGEPAVVTALVETNVAADVWAPLDPADYADLSGYINEPLANRTEPYVAYWRPAKRELASDAVRYRVSLTAWMTNSPPDYMSFDIGNGEVKYFVSSNAVPGGVQSRVYKTQKMLFRRIPAAGIRWVMGSSVDSDTSTYHASNESYRYVTLSEDYYIGVFETTWQQWWSTWTTWGGSTGTIFTNRADSAIRPVHGLDYCEARGSTNGKRWPIGKDVDQDTLHQVDSSSFMGRMRSLSGGKIRFDLPTEAQWEYACRAGCGGPLYDGSSPSSANLDRLGRNSDNSLVEETGIKETSAVGSYAPNAWGLYDMLGNVNEMVCDYYSSNLGTAEETDPVGPDNDSSSASKNRVFKGGYYADGIKNCRAAYRSYANQTAHKEHEGMRVACPAVAVP